MLPGMSFEDRVVLITGGANGFGRATGARLTEQGAKVVLADIEEEAGEEAAAEIGAEFVGWRHPSGDDRTLGVVGFSIFPHLDGMPSNTMQAAERWAAALDGPAYAIDDQTALRVVDGTVDVISEGHWRRFDR